MTRPAAAPQRDDSDERDLSSGALSQLERTHRRILESERLIRYAWVARLAPGCRVLDAACGSGRGTEILARASASEVVGVDVDEDVVAWARRPAPSGVRFDVGDLGELPYGDDDFDLVVCFEALERATERGRILDELQRVVKPDGVVAISIPNREASVSGNPLHPRELTPTDLEAQLATRFRSVALRSQRTWLASGIFDDQQVQTTGNQPIERIELAKAHADEPGRETFTMALAGDRDLPSPGSMVSLTADVELREWGRWVERVHQETSEAAHRTAATSDAERELLRREVAELRVQLAAGETEIARLIGVEAQLAAVAPALREREALLSSLSWRITRPLRSLSARIRRP